MRIGIDARLWNETGVGRYIRSLFCFLFELDKENEYIWFFRDEEFNSIELPNKKWKKVRANIHWHSLSEQLMLPWIFYREKLDLLHFPYFSFPIIYPGKFIVTVHDLIYDHFKSGKTSTLPYFIYLLKKIGYHLVIWIALVRSKKIITLSTDAKKEIIDHYSINSNKIIVTYESGSLEDKRTHFPENKFSKVQKLQPYILYVGNAHPHKNVESLIEAMSYIKKRKNSWRLVLLGDDNFFYTKLKAYIKSKNLEQTVISVGAVPNTQIAAWYHFATCLVSASHMEGFGIPPLEAMSVGCPVIVSDIPVFHEIYADAAAYFDQNDPQNISATIMNIIDDKKRVNLLIENGYRRTKLFSWSKMARETISVYNSMSPNI